MTIVIQTANYESLNEGTAVETKDTSGHYGIAMGHSDEPENEEFSPRRLE